MDRHDIRKKVEIQFADQVREVGPLSLKQLRKFVKVISKMNAEKSEAEFTDDDIDMMLDAAEIIMAKVDASLDREWLEDNIDIVTFRQLMEVAMGASSPNE